ncbi:MAG: hypothetical protein HN727_10235 [Opitutae bacterium]|nr:hypothetical protein [Opitutae bacterium]
MSTELPRSVDNLKTVTDNGYSRAESALEGIRFENLFATPAPEPIPPHLKMATLRIKGTGESV